MASVINFWRGASCPNHVHVVIRSSPGEQLPEDPAFMGNLTPRNEANQVLGRTGEFWQSEYYDHIVRDGQELTHAVEYAWNNPDRAGLSDWQWRGKSELLIRELLIPSPDQGPTHGR